MEAFKDYELAARLDVRKAGCDRDIIVLGVAIVRMHQDGDALDEVSLLQKHVLRQEPAIIAERIDIGANRLVDAADVLVDGTHAASATSS